MDGYAVFGSLPKFPGLRGSPSEMASYLEAARKANEVPETDAQRIARLSEEVGRLTADLHEAQRELRTAYAGDWRSAQKFDGTPVSITLDGVDMVVAVWHDGDPDSDRYVTSVWTGQGWMCQDDLRDDFLERAMNAVLEQENEA
jgi:hypothetical protein